MTKHLLRLGLVLTVFMLSATVVVAKGGASIAAPDGLSFGDQFTPTFVEPNSYKGVLYTRADCSQGGALVYRQYVPAGNAHTLGPTMLWSGGAADCEVFLMSLYGLSPGDVEWARDEFVVSAGG